MTLGDHLGELRRRLLVAGMAVLLGGIVMFVLYNHVLALLLRPYCQIAGRRGCHLYVTGPLDGLSIRVKVAAYGGFLLASPVVLWEVWRFIAPGLHRRERHHAVPFVASSVLLFVAGSAVAFASFPHALRFLAAVGGPELHQLYSPESYLGLLLLMMAAFGITFELPVLLVFLQLARVVTPQRLASWRRFAIVGLVLLAAVITPSGDPFSMLALAVPLVVFYEGSILVGRVLTRPRAGAAVAGPAGTGDAERDGDGAELEPR